MPGADLLHVWLPAGVTRLAAMHWSLPPHQLVAVIGPNGAGKSTLLQAIAGDMPALHRHIHLLNRPLHQWTPQTLARHRALLPQQPVETLPLSVTTAIELGLQAPLPDWPAHPVTEALELSSLLRRDLTTLSGGERQRVHLARTCLQLISAQAASSVPLPQLLLLDESLQMLDVRHRQRFLTFLSRWRRQQPLSILWVSHDLNLALEWADQALLLASGGRCLALGPVRDVMTDDRLRQLFDWPLEVRTCNGRQVVLSGGSSSSDQRGRAEKSSGLR